MHEWLPIVAAVGIGVALGASMELTPFGAAMLCGGLGALIQYFGG